MTDNSGTGAGTLNPFRYRGYFYDDEMGWYYLKSRYYDLEVGKFINADVFYYDGHGIKGYNMYCYCGNEPWPWELRESYWYIRNELTKDNS